jgi:hypothetical protein
VPQSKPRKFKNQLISIEVGVYPCLQVIIYLQFIVEQVGFWYKNKNVKNILHNEKKSVIMKT